MTVSKRRKRLLLGAAILLGAGLLYALWINITGLAIPCVFRLITGLYCPGCGVTTLCLSLLRLDFSAAWEANAVLLLSLPFLALLLGRLCFRYVKTGSVMLCKWETVLCGAQVVVFLIWGAVRNVCL